MSDEEHMRRALIVLLLLFALGFVVGWYSSQNFYCARPLADARP